VDKGIPKEILTLVKRDYASFYKKEKVEAIRKNFSEENKE
jgi:hypothetical protein